MRPVTDLQRKVAPFEVVSDMVPAGDQPTAIADISRRIRAGDEHTVLLGATGTGKTATVAWIAEQLQRPLLVMLPNKTLAAQFANELREMLPNNAVEYFVSYYDYYQPEAYVPQTDTYIEKDSSINARGGAAQALRHQLACSPGGTPSSSPPCRASTAWARRRSTWTGCSGSSSATRSSARPCCASWSACSTRATTWPSPAAPSGSAATPSRSSRCTRSSRSGSRCSATRSSG